MRSLVARMLLGEAFSFALGWVAILLWFGSQGWPVDWPFGIHFAMYVCAWILTSLALAWWRRRRASRGDSGEVPFSVGPFSEIMRKIRDGTGIAYTGGPEPDFPSLPVSELFAVTDPKEFEYALQDHLMAKEFRSNPDTMTATERLLSDVRGLDREVGNGGLHQYFFNSAGDRADAVVSSLDAIGASQAAGIMRRALTVFDGTTPESDRGGRWEQMDAWTDEEKDLLAGLTSELYRARQDLGQLIAAYARAHQDDFSDVVED